MFKSKTRTLYIANVSRIRGCTEEGGHCSWDCS